MILYNVPSKPSQLSTYALAKGHHHAIASEYIPPSCNAHLNTSLKITPDTYADNPVLLYTDYYLVQFCANHSAVILHFEPF